MATRGVRSHTVGYDNMVVWGIVTWHLSGVRPCLVHGSPLWGKVPSVPSVIFPPLKYCGTVRLSTSLTSWMWLCLDFLLLGLADHTLAGIDLHSLYYDRLCYTWQTAYLYFLLLYSCLVILYSPIGAIVLPFTFQIPCFNLVVGRAFCAL